MKNIDVLFMVNSGTLNITNYELDPKSAYKVVKFRNALNKALDKITETERALLKDAGIENVYSFNKDLEDLSTNKNRTFEEDTKLKEMEEKNQKYNALRFEMLNEEISLDDVLPMSYEDWHTLRKENRPKDENQLDPLNNHIEYLLENILWKAPDEE